MTARNVRGRIAAACVAMTLVPVGAALAQTRNDPAFDLCRTPRSQMLEAPPAAAPELRAPTVPLIRINDTPPWFRKTFYLFGTDGTCPVRPAIVAPVTRAPVGASLAASVSRPPGAVKNLRRTDRR